MIKRLKLIKQTRKVAKYIKRCLETSECLVAINKI